LDELALNSVLRKFLQFGYVENSTISKAALMQLEISKKKQNPKDSKACTVIRFNDDDIQKII